MEEILNFIHATFFGSVAFLNLLLIAMFIDIVSGIFKAIKNGRLRSRTAWQGYARKLLSLFMVVAAHILDVIFELSGVLATLTVLFLLAVELQSFFENCAEMNMRVPKILVRKLQIFNDLEYQKSNKENNGGNKNGTN